MMKQILGKLPKKPSKSANTAADESDSPIMNSSNFNAVVGANGFSKITPPPSNVGLNGTSTFEALPSFRDVPNAEKQNLFLAKLKMCCIIFDFSDDTKNLKEKEIKRQTLLELVDYISSVNSRFNEIVMQEITKMVALNLFRTFPSSHHDHKLPDIYEVDEEDLAMEPSWSHLQIVYEFLLRFVASSETDAKLAKRYIDHSFLLHLLDLFDSEDPREREYLKTILHRIYGKFMVHRPFIRKAINNVFYRFILETEKQNGIAELLEILGSIVNGFALPLKEEHKFFLSHALIPLHKPKCVSMYHQQLSYCITQFVEKDFKLADTVIRGLLKYWPVSNSSKEILLLGELEEVLEATQASEFQLCTVPLFRQIGRCLSSSHFQVAERALLLWNNDRIRNMITQNGGVILPIIFPALERNSRHWNQAVQSLTINVRKIFSEADQSLFNDCLEKYQGHENKENLEQEKRQQTWKRLEDEAASKAEPEPEPEPENGEALFVSKFGSSVAIS